jgi:outer membrane protein, heavy metal efflux system
MSAYVAMGVAAALGSTCGCAGTRSPIPDGANIIDPILISTLEEPTPPNPLPPAPTIPAPPTPVGGALRLENVISSVTNNFPLLLAVEQEREITAGQRLSAEGGFDTQLRARASDQNGSFSNGRLDFSAEQPILANGGSVFGGWRLGDGNFPIYSNDRKTADGGEFRAGITMPLLRDRNIDRRRVALRQAQISEQLADPLIMRARLDFARSAAFSYWSWVAAGEQYRIAQELLNLANVRQKLFDAQAKAGAIADTQVALNRRLVAAREEAVLASERLVQAAAIRLSLFLRTDNADPIIPQASQLPTDFFANEPTKPTADQLTVDVQTALQNRPEFTRLTLLKERAATDLALARNRIMPGLNAFVAASQDVGFSKKTFSGSGPFGTDRTNAEFGLTFELEAQRREALGRLRTAQGQMAQLLNQERYTRDEITTQVQDAVSELQLTSQRLERAREELKQANRVLELETASFKRDAINLVQLNLQEVAAAEAQVKVASLLAQYYRALAEYYTTLGLVPVQP